MTCMNKSLSIEDFACLFGADIDDFDDECRQFISQTDFGYRKLNSKERDKTILEVLRRIDSGELAVAGKERICQWDKGWSENLKNFISSGYDLAELTPKYVRPNQVLRLYRDYVMPSDANFELNFFTVLRLWLFKKYLGGFDDIYEFGCGPAYNLPLIAKMYPEKRLYGLDWSEAAVKIVNLLHSKHKINAVGCLFDMYSPDYGLKMSKNSVVITIGGLEQLGEDYQRFFRFLQEKAPRLCVHVEPLCELYDENNLVDYLAIRFHKARNYLDGLLTYLQRLESFGGIEIIKTQRMYFGSLFHDGWSMVIWKPRENAKVILGEPIL